MGAPPSWTLKGRPSKYASLFVLGQISKFPALARKVPEFRETARPAWASSTGRQSSLRRHSGQTRKSEAMPRELQSTTSMTFGNMALVERVYDDGSRAYRQINLVTGKTVATSFYDGRGYHFNKYFVDGSKEYINVKNIPWTMRERALGRTAQRRHRLNSQISSE